jgi:xanthine dehydrogenase accessory factor
MRDILATLQQWRAEGKCIALATVVRVEGSVPRREGARLAVSSTGEMVGSVSGGCVENDVFRHAQEVLKGGEPRLLCYAITDDMTWEVGLACGGAIEVWVERLDPVEGVTAEARPCLQAELERAIAAGHLVALATLLSGQGCPGAKLLVWQSGKLLGSLGDEQIDHQVAADALAMMRYPHAESREYATPVARVFVEILPPPPHLVIFGGVHLAIPLAAMARILGYRVTIADPRAQFANRDRFPHADQIISEWPQQAVEQIEIGPSTYCVILTHDPKIDEPALRSLLGKGAGYVGAIGSYRTHVERFARLARYGVSAEQLDGIYAPIGLDLGAVTPEEIALAIMAEITAVRRGAAGDPMRNKTPVRSSERKTE